MHFVHYVGKALEDFGFPLAAFVLFGDAYLDPLERHREFHDNSGITGSRRGRKAEKRPLVAVSHMWSLRSSEKHNFLAEAQRAQRKAS
jgi:hypothetical protein